ncbi:hypothetical protein GCM10027160_24340 [Streptomyces calidiresistens]
MSCVALLNALTVWLIGLSPAGLDLKEACEYWNGVPFDEQWHALHHMESQKWFPLHAKCNANVDLVPAWINPMIIALVVLSIACLCMAIYLGVRKFLRVRKKTHV